MAPYTVKTMLKKFSLWVCCMMALCPILHLFNTLFTITASCVSRQPLPITLTAAPAACKLEPRRIWKLIGQIS